MVKTKTSSLTKRLKIAGIATMILIGIIFDGHAQKESSISSRQKEKPNILLIISDQLNWDYMSAMGNPYVRTPNIDRLLNAGIRFDKAYTVNPACLPSRVSMFTGGRPSKFGVHVPKGIDIQRTDMVAYAKEKKIAHKIQEQGYKTYYGGKTHFGPRGYKFTPEDMGFEVYAGEYEYRGMDCVPQAINTLQRHRSNYPHHPFFMVTSLMNPHDICYAHIQNNGFDMEKILQRTKGEGWKAKLRTSVLETLKIPIGHPGAGGYEPVDYYLRQAPPLPDNYLPQTDEPSVISGIGEEKGMAPAFGRYRGQYSDTEWLLHRYAYCRFVEEFDKELGLLLDGLEASGMAENTCIIFTSDHGESLGSHQMAGKGLFFDEVCHVPFVVIHPDLEGGRIDSVNLISNGLDIIPTIFELAGVDKDPGLEGQSIVPLLYRTNARMDRKAVPIEFSTGLGIVTNDFYYGIYYNGKDNNEQLYDMRKRPLQMVNDALDPSYTEHLKQHRKQFKETHHKTLVHYGQPDGFVKWIDGNNDQR
ncbi:sulfatase-like hydrolase/transferase [Parapedobacter sp. SGR-10]|uniref:sulfatase family protein n=1 Tax=Parapedobacter sp. SGR-10 TaxID=2710879 RepID=UPI0013D39D0C|nr:sulfatase-like hydrolase/transferase [Parapedobacter sp. SGR-10]NGF55920.1 sulfatase-like hydrolase/transferase [Parapedobacter sp. SGR-10]